MQVVWEWLPLVLVADAVDVMAGMAWELKMPKLIGVKLTWQGVDMHTALHLAIKHFSAGA